MGLCVKCGQKAIEIEALFFRDEKAFSVKLGKNYCINCGSERIKEIEKKINGHKNPLVILSVLRYFEELEMIE